MATASTSVDMARSVFLGSYEVVGCVLAGTSVFNDVKANLLPFDKRTQAGPLNCRRVNEYVRFAVIERDEAEALDAIEKLYSSSVHDSSFSKS
jgi:dTDP-glucose pyrophosphorylase